MTQIIIHQIPYEFQLVWFSQATLVKEIDINEVNLKINFIVFILLLTNWAIIKWENNSSPQTIYHNFIKQTNQPVNQPTNHLTDQRAFSFIIQQHHYHLPLPQLMSSWILFSIFAHLLIHTNRNIYLFVV